MSNHSYYRNTGKPFPAKKPGYCLLCKGEIKVGEQIVVLFFTKGRMPMHQSCSFVKNNKEASQ